MSIIKRTKDTSLVKTIEKNVRNNWQWKWMEKT